MKTTKELIDLIQVKSIGENIFLGENETIGSANVFGGQVLAQALSAAYQTVPNNRFCHSLHAYFILAGDLDKPITYNVTKIRDGGSFTTRYVIAQQNNVPIFIMAASFQLTQKGYEHQDKAPTVKPPEELLSWDEIYEQTKDFLPPSLSNFLSLERPITFKPTTINNPIEKKDLPPFQNVWVRLKEKKEELLPQIIHPILAYISDYNILSTAIQPHASKANFSNTQMASLDHSMWFHRPTDLNDWLLFNINTPSASNARGFTRGNLFSRDGKLIASVSQEGLIRPKN